MAISCEISMQLYAWYSSGGLACSYVHGIRMHLLRNEPFFICETFRNGESTSLSEGIVYKKRSAFGRIVSAQVAPVIPTRAHLIPKFLRRQRKCG
jgi:hypothetical protein